MSNPITKRLLKEMKEIKERGVDGFSHVNVEDLRTVNFVCHGSEGTPFEGGQYVGKLILPKDYPHSPPTVMFLTPNGRFKPGEAICTSISSYHPETWSSLLKIETVLISLRSFMNSDDVGVGAAPEMSLPLDCRNEVQKRFAADSIEYNRRCFADVLNNEEITGKRKRDT
jgi:ubiquitin-protein ligase